MASLMGTNPSSFTTYQQPMQRNVIFPQTSTYQPNDSFAPMNSINSVATQQRAPNPPAVGAAIGEYDLKLRMDKIKSNLKKKSTFDEGLSELTELLPKYLNYETKKMFYDALNIISYRVGKPGFGDVKKVQQLFQLALDKKQHFSPGYRKNIEEWKQVVDGMVSNPAQTQMRDDGRFNNATSSKPRKRKTNSLDPIELLMLRSLFGSPRSMFEDDSSSDSDYDSSNYSFFPRVVAEPPMIPVPVQSSTPSPPEYPFSRFREEPALLDTFKVPHTEEPTNFTYRFLINSFMLERVFSSATLKVTLCCYQATDLSHGVASPDGLTFKINDQKVFTTGSFYHGYDISNFCRAGINTLTICTTDCCCGFQFGVRLSEYYDFEELKQKVIAKKTDINECKHRVTQILGGGSDAEIQALSTRVSVKDPYSYSRITVPVRGKQCKHLQCFDLSSYLEVNKRNPKFKCPVCCKIAAFSELTVDSYFEKILTDLSHLAPVQTDHNNNLNNPSLDTSSNVNNQEQEVEEVEIFPDATWRIAQKQKPGTPSEKKRKATSQPENSPAAKRIDVVDVDDVNVTDSKFMVPLKPLLKPKVEVIDLT